MVVTVLEPTWAGELRYPGVGFRKGGIPRVSRGGGLRGVGPKLLSNLCQVWPQTCCANVCVCRGGGY